MRILLLSWLFFWLIPHSGAYAGFELAMPVDCAMGRDCVVQNYVDHDSATGDDAYHDFTCGRLSYDGHKGTDIRTVNLAVMERGVRVLAAADGRVLGMRDSVADGAPAVQNQECGNGVRIAHQEGWITQYCHLRQGSVRVKIGDTVQAGDELGLIGLSGSTQFPHVHLQVEHNGVIIDPYTGAAMAGTSCGTQAADGIWNSDAAEQLAYRATGLLGSGFADRRPEKGEVQKGTLTAEEFPRTTPILLFWAEMYGLREGDIAYIALQDTDGVVLAEQRQEIPRSRAVQHYFVGKGNPDLRWEPGDYTGVVRVTRAGAPVLEHRKTLKVL